MFKNQKKVVILLCASLAIANSYSFPGLGNSYVPSNSNAGINNGGNSGSASQGLGYGNININGCDPNPCSEAQTCINGKCFDKCKFTECEEGAQCDKGECIPIDPCRNVKCQKWHECIDAKCIAFDPCRDVKCQQYYQCSLGQCLVADPCFGACKGYEECNVKGQCIDKCQNMKCDYGCSQGQCKGAPQIPNVGGQGYGSSNGAGFGLGSGAGLGSGYVPAQRPQVPFEQQEVVQQQEEVVKPIGSSSYAGLGSNVRQSVGNSGGSFNPRAQSGQAPAAQTSLETSIGVGPTGGIQININTGTPASGGYSKPSNTGNSQSGYATGSQGPASGSSIGITKCEKDYECGYGKKCQRGFCQ